MDRLILTLGVLACIAGWATAASAAGGGPMPMLRDQSRSIARGTSCAEHGGAGGPILEIREEMPAADPCGGCDRRWRGRFNPVREYCHENIVSGTTSCRECALFLSVSYPSCGVVTDLR